MFWVPPWMQMPHPWFTVTWSVLILNVLLSGWNGSSLYVKQAPGTTCWETILRGISAHRVTAFVAEYLLKDVGTANSLGGQRWCLSPEQRADLSPNQHSKDNVFLGTRLGRVASCPLWDWGFLSVGLPAVPQTHCVFSTHFISRVGLGEQREPIQTWNSGFLLCHK